MFDHITVTVSDFHQSLAFYRDALGAIGYEAQYVDEKGKSAGFGPKGDVVLWIGEGKKPSAVHLAFKGTSHASVKKFYDAALKNGGKDNGPPGPRPDYGSDYWAAFAFDPDGNNIEVVTRASK